MIHIEDLPDEILIHILTLLGRYQDIVKAGQVCRRWTILCHDDELWKHVWRKMDCGPMPPLEMQHEVGMFQLFKRSVQLFLSWSSGQFDVQEFKGK